MFGGVFLGGFFGFLELIKFGDIGVFKGVGFLREWGF